MSVARRVGEGKKGHHRIIQKGGRGGGFGLSGRKAAHGLWASCCGCERGEIRREVDKVVRA